MNTKTKPYSGFKHTFCEGIRDGIPIGMGYLAVSFSLGVAAKSAGLNAFQGFLISFFNNASAGEYAGLTVIAADAAYLEMVLITLIANARYLLMSCALSQHIPQKLALRHRLLLGYYITDELFGITVARSDRFTPFYTYGAVFVAAPCWAVGTALGVIAGNMLPSRVVSALSVALFGMFLAIIVPPARKNLRIAGCVLTGFAASFCAAKLPWVGDLSEGTRTIILTVIISSAAALLFPVKPPEPSSGPEGDRHHDT